MKKIIIIILFCLSFYHNTEAKLRIHGGGAIMRTGLKSYMLDSNRSYSSFTSKDIETCQSNQTKDSFLCDSLDSLELTSQRKIIDDLQKDIASTYVNQYNQGSVDYYNGKIAKGNTLVTKYNNLLKEKCTSVEEFCRPYECNKKYPGTIYKKVENMCLCANGQEYNETLGKNEGNGCKKKEEEITKLPIDESNNIQSQNSDSQETKKTSGNDFGGIIVLILETSAISIKKHQKKGFYKKITFLSK